MFYENTTPQQPYAPVQQIPDVPKVSEAKPSTTKLDLNSIKGYSQKEKL